jgi:serine/threonine-protein kinase
MTRKCADRDQILNQTRTSARWHLLEATKDTDWWVSERAVDALGEIASKKSVPRLLEMLKSNPKSVPSVVRALGKIGDSAAIESVLQALERPETDIRVEAMSALVRLADDRSVDPVRARIAPLANLTDQSVAGAAIRALTEPTRASAAPRFPVPTRRGRRQPRRHGPARTRSAHS